MAIETETETDMGIGHTLHASGTVADSGANHLREFRVLALARVEVAVPGACRNKS